MINPTSKLSLKMSCLAACKGDVKQAQAMVEYFLDGMDALPDFDPPQPTMVQRAKGALDEFFGVLDQNEERIIKAVNYYNMFKGRPQPPSQPLPPLPNQ
jgi:hypothetical protein